VPSLEALIAFALTSLVLIAIPGPSVLFVIGRSLAWGRSAGLWTVLGNELGSLVPIGAVAFGVGAIVAQSVALFTVVKVLGALYLAYLGIQAIRHRRDGVGDASEASPRRVSSLVMLRQGFIVGATNPKTIVFFVAALPQFVDFHAGAVPVQMMILGLVFTVIAFACDATWALIAGSARAWFAKSPRRLAAVRGTGGGMMIGLGGVLLLADNKT